MCDDSFFFFNLLTVLQHLDASLPNNNVIYNGKCSFN